MATSKVQSIQKQCLTDSIIYVYLPKNEDPAKRLNGETEAAVQTRSRITKAICSHVLRGNVSARHSPRKSSPDCYLTIATIIFQGLTMPVQFQDNLTRLLVRTLKSERIFAEAFVQGSVNGGFQALGFMSCGVGRLCSFPVVIL